MHKNKKVLESALNHMIAKKIEKYNKDNPRISRKLEEKIKRISLKTKTFDKIIENQGSVCFYCEKKPKKGKKFAQEHFIPWNFVFDTVKYNIVAACPTCNSSKNDKLPDTKYKKLLLDRNDKIEDLPYGYSRDLFNNLYEACWLEYHGKDQKLWNHEKITISSI